MSGGKGPSQSGSITQSTTNPTQAAQLPFLTGGVGANTASGNTNVGWNQAYNLATNNPFQYYPGQTMAGFNPAVGQGYNDLIATGQSVDSTLRPAGNGIFTNAASGGMGVQNSPAYTILQALAAGGGNQYGQQQGLVDLASSVRDGTAPLQAQLGELATALQGPDAGTDQLGSVAKGDYLNSNPYLDKMFGSASDAVTRAFQTATAPQTDAKFAAAGRYGSGALAGARSQNESNLGTQLGGMAANIYGSNYQAERARQDSAAGLMDSILNDRNRLSQSAVTASGNLGLGANQIANSALTASGQLGLAGSGLQKSAADTLQQGYQSGNNNAMQALSLFPSLLNAQYGSANAELQGGQGLTGMDQAQIDDATKRFYRNIQAPWQTNQSYLNQVGQPTTGSSSTTTPVLGPSPLSSLLGLAGGAKSLFGSSGLGGKGAASVAPWATDAAGASVPLDAAALAGSSAIDFGGGGAAAGKGLSEALPFIFSDRRLKRDIERVDTLPNGLPAYSFRYLWSEEPQVGLMADEVEQLHPEAVVVGPGGFKMVDYGRAVQPAV